MRQTPTTTTLGIVLVVSAMTAALSASAGKLDLTLARFANCDAAGVCNPLYADYETFMAEYAFGLAPKKMAPAETLGFSGFYMGFEAPITLRPLGNAAENRWEIGTPTDEVQAFMFTPTIHIRKGLPFSFEVGSTVSYLAQSEILVLGGEVKWALFEGYRTGWRAFLPDVAARGTINRIIGSSDVDMSVVGVDASISYAFGVGGMITLTPFAGYQYTWTIINLEPMLYKDGSGYHTETTNATGDKTWNVSDLGNPLLMRSNAFFGLRVGYALLAYTFELDWGMPNSWTTDGGGGKPAKVGHQIAITNGIGVDF